MRNLLTALKKNIQIIKKMIKIQLQNFMLIVMINHFKHKEKIIIVSLE